MFIYINHIGFKRMSSSEKYEINMTFWLTLVVKGISIVI